MPGPARFQRRGDPANNGFRDVGHKLARLIDAFARSLHRVGNTGAVHHASAVEAAPLRGDQSRQLSEVPETCRSNGCHSRFGPLLPAWATQQVVGYLGYTDRDADVVVTAAHD